MLSAYRSFTWRESMEEDGAGKVSRRTITSLPRDTSGNVSGRLLRDVNSAPRLKSFFIDKSAVVLWQKYSILFLFSISQNKEQYLMGK